MGKSTQAENPWVSKHLFDTLQTRCADAEQCLRQLLNLIDPDVLTEHAGDWQAATHAVLGSNKESV